MIHFLYLAAFALFASVCFSIFIDGDLKRRVLFGLKTFAQFVGIALLLAWVFYFIPWK
jgi:hypothetical protein